MLQLSLLSLILFFLFIVSSVVLLIFYIYCYQALRTYVPNSTQRNEEAVSVIVVAKNEAINLQKFLPQILNQKYADFEVIVVDDHSSDNSWEILEELSNVYPKLFAYKQDKSKVGKKPGIQKAIQKAKNNLFLFIDADCHPASDLWIQLMANKCMGEVQIVLGYGRYSKENSFLNKLVRYDTILTGIRYLAFAIKGKAYMSVGRNLMYRREVYDRSTVFERFAYFPYGDDDLIVNEMSTARNTSVCFEPTAHTISIPKQYWKHFFLQKIRHLSAGKFYRTSNKFILALESFARIAFIISAVLLILMGYLEIFVFMGIIWVFQFMLFSKAGNRLNDSDILKYLPLLEVIHIFFLGFCSLFSLFNKKVSWK